MADIIPLNRDDRALLLKTPLIDGPRAQLPCIAAAAEVKARKAEQGMQSLVAAGLVKPLAGNRFILVRDERSLPTLHHYGITAAG